MFRVWIRQQLAGSLSEKIGDLTNLQHLSLGGNYLNGTLPSSIRQLENLVIMDLAYNRITGLGDGVGGLSNITTLSVAWNSVSGQIPESVGNLSKLEKL